LAGFAIVKSSTITPFHRSLPTKPRMIKAIRNAKKTEELNIGVALLI
jgi:hypothetical protein